ncbi:protein FAR1-RELATED SEQUENCE 5-like [Chenopodium quinoa]|uniref:protein FAR1-RELATED SEQUENCE 5-like n=1 Tax=Chenopodium quinoa TaxID=63459 RepID=UPI000B782F71|nr:protein FAR1-RELATED SEQUENCE 5-like [Chenopodium quinoa]
MMHETVGLSSPDVQAGDVNYASDCGFKIHSSTSKVEKKLTGPDGKKGLVLIKYLVGNKEGFVNGNKKDKKDVEGVAFRKTIVRRIGCPAMIKFKYCDGGKYMVYFFHESHYHPFSTPITRQVTKPYDDGLTCVHRKFIFDNSKLNIRLVMFYRMMKEYCGGYKHVRGTKNQFKNFSRDLKVYISEADGAMFIENIQHKVNNSNGGYYLDYCVNATRHLTRCMGNEPSCLITDQDPAMGIAIQNAFTKTKHRLCMWHIMRKVPEKVGTTFCNDNDFLKEFCAVVWDREIEPNEFVDGWNTVIEKYDLISHECYYGDGVEFSVVVDDERQRNFNVTFDLSTLECTCTCKMFESLGVLCRHILFIIKGKSVSEIPEHYVLNRWRKDAKKKSTSVDEASNFDKKKQLISDVW